VKVLRDLVLSETNRWGFGTLLLVLISQGLARADFTATRFDVLRADLAPTIDGDLSDGAWSRAAVIDQFFQYRSGGDPAAAEGTARFLWDDNALYVGLEMQDIDIRSACALSGSCGNDASLFNGDVIELFIKELPGRTKYFEFEWSPLGEFFDGRFDNAMDPRWSTLPGVSWDSTATWAVQVHGTVDNPSDTDTGWTVEAVIPLADLGPISFGRGSEWYFTVARYDYFNVPAVMTPALMMSTPGDPAAPNGGVTFGFHSYEIYDVLHFSAVPEPSFRWVLVTSLGLGHLGLRDPRSRWRQRLPEVELCLELRQGSAPLATR
jgi:hypothetical protein